MASLKKENLLLRLRTGRLLSYLLSPVSVLFSRAGRPAASRHVSRTPYTKPVRYSSVTGVRLGPGWTPLHRAAVRGGLAVAKLLLANGADPNVKDKFGKTPIDIWPELAEIIKEVKAEKAKDKK